MHATLYISAGARFGILITVLVADIAVGKRQGKNIYGICPKSKDTVKDVVQCPRNQEEWRKRNDKMNCASVQQYCTEPENFIYHCLPDSHWNKTIEVCTPRKRIVLQKCAEYNEEGMRVQTNFEHSCSDTENPCPMHYLSDNAYKYQQCYKTKNKVIMNISQPGENELRPTVEISSCSYTHGLQPVCIRTMLLVVAALRIYHVQFIVT